MYPVARTDQLLKQKVGKELIVYDESNDTACCLNPVAAMVWRHCDGQQSVDQLADILASQLDLPREIEPQAAVWRALEDLEKHNLIASIKSAEPSVPVESIKVMSRRRAIKYALVGLALIPTVKSIVTPTLAMAASEVIVVTPTITL